MVIYKYEITTIRPIEMHAGASLIHVASQLTGDYVWAIVDPQAPIVGRRLHAYATGVPISPRGVYVGTFHTDSSLSGEFVFHVFDLGEEPA